MNRLFNIDLSCVGIENGLNPRKLIKQRMNRTFTSNSLASFFNIGVFFDFTFNGLHDLGITVK